MKRVRIHEIGAFSTEDYLGNKAGVCLEEGLSPQDKQAIAKVLGYSETVFLEGNQVRYYTPEEEIDFCGHGSIALMSILDEKKRSLQGKNMIINLRQLGKIAEVQIAPPKFYLMDLPKGLLESLGINWQDLHDHLPICKGYSGVWDLFIPLKNQEILDALSPDMEAISALSKRLGVVGYHVFAPGQVIDYHARNFAPLYGIEEEGATGSSNGALVAYHHMFTKEAPNRIVIKQGEKMGAPCLLYGEHLQQEPPYIGGHTTYIKEIVLEKKGELEWR